MVPRAYQSGVHTVPDFNSLLHLSFSAKINPFVYFLNFLRDKILLDYIINGVYKASMFFSACHFPPSRIFAIKARVPRLRKVASNLQ